MLLQYCTRTNNDGILRISLTIVTLIQIDQMQVLNHLPPIMYHAVVQILGWQEVALTNPSGSSDAVAIRKLRSPLRMYLSSHPLSLAPQSQTQGKVRAEPPSAALGRKCLPLANARDCPCIPK